MRRRRPVGRWLCGGSDLRHLTLLPAPVVAGALEMGRVKVVFSVAGEGLDFRDRPRFKLFHFRLDQWGVGLRAAADCLTGIVDQDVERAFRSDRVGQVNHLARVSQVDADNVEATKPVIGVVHRPEASDCIVWKAGRDRGVCAVPEQSQSDVHPDLGPAPGQQRPFARQVSAGVPSGMIEGGAVRAELMVESVDHVEALFADVTGAWFDQGAGCGAFCLRNQWQAFCFVVDPAGCGGSGPGGDPGVMFQHLPTLLQLAAMP